MSLSLLYLGGIDRYAAITQYGLGLPEFEQYEQRDEAHDCAGDVGQIGPQMDGNRILACDIAERSDHGERPAAFHSLLAGDQVQKHPRRQQRQHGDHGADRRPTAP